MGRAKEILFDVINAELKPIRSRYEDLIKDKNYINDVLSDGSKKTRLLAQEKISEIREVIGIKKNILMSISGSSWLKFGLFTVGLGQSFVLS